MKRCPECRRDYFDDSLLYCLDDGERLLEGPASGESLSPASDHHGLGSQFDEPQTAILHETAPPREAMTAAQIHTTEQTAVLPKSTSGSSKTKSPDRRLLVVSVLLAMAAVGGVIGYKYLSPAKHIESIAVLPFHNSGGNADSEYLSDGLAESLIYRLSQIPELKVSPRSSVFRYKGKEIDSEAVGAELGVDAVMSGRVVQRGDDLTISVDLVDVRNRKTIWGEQYERKMSDLLATQREIATAITEKLQLKLSGNERGITKKYTNSNQAYQLYLKGRHAWNKRTRESLKEAVEHYNRAIDQDPSFALAYSGLADAYVLFPNYDVASARDSMPQAKAAAMRALELDETLAEAHTAYAYYLMLYEYDFKGSEAEFRRAIELDPKYPTARQWYGEMLSKLKRFDEAMAETRTAQELDPLSPVIEFNIGMQHYVARRYDEALAAFGATADKFPEFKVASFGPCYVWYAKGDLVKAAAECRKARESVPDAPTDGYLGMVLARAGEVEEARNTLRRLQEESTRRHVTPAAFAYIYIGLGQKEEALRMMEREVAERGYLAPDLAVYPEYDEYRAEPRFKALLKQMNLPG